MSPAKTPRAALLCAGLLLVSPLAGSELPIGASARFLAEELGPGWHRGFLNRLRTLAPCYVVVIFEPRSSPDEPLRMKRTISIARLGRLQVSASPGTSMQEWRGIPLPAVPEHSWQEVDLERLASPKDECRLDGSVAR